MPDSTIINAAIQSHSTALESALRCHAVNAVRCKVWSAGNVAGMIVFATERAQMAALAWAAATVVLLALADAGQSAMARVFTDAYNRFMQKLPLNGGNAMKAEDAFSLPPPETDEPQGADTVRLRYEFAVVPAPLLPRFMVRTFSLTEQAKLWQRGAMLRYPGARARVWTTAEEKYLFATVAGPEGDSTELLSIIRSTLTELFTEYRQRAP